MKRALLFYLGKGTGHHSAALALEEAIREHQPDSEVRVLDALQQTHPLVSEFVFRTYLGIIKRTPDLWDFLYDSRLVQQRTARLRRAIHRADSVRLRRLLEEFRPHAIFCTQAFPCAVLAECKQAGWTQAPLVGVLTDFMPHLYWFYPETDLYCVPSDKSRLALISTGVPEDKIRVTGIPINPKFALAQNRHLLCAQFGLPMRTFKVLLMGGGYGLAPMRDIVLALDAVERPFEIIAITGRNERTQRQLAYLAPRLRRRLHLFGFTPTIDQWMEIADVLVTKPGGLTVSEALAKRLPMILTQPLPGQEMKNAEFLLRARVARLARSAHEVARHVQRLYDQPQLAARMRTQAELLRRPYAVRDIVQQVQELTR